MKNLFVVKRSVTLFLVAFALVVGAGFLEIRNNLPAMPSEWMKLRLGMSRDETMKTLRGRVTDLREAKGYDVISHETQMLGKPGFWQLQISYDALGRITDAKIQFTHRTFAVLNSGPKALLQMP